MRDARRDQIKGWISSDEIREKDPLLKARRTIEERMELFKKSEKSSKTKSFSKAGLAQADRLDPTEQARQATREWVDDALQQIREQKEVAGADLEALVSKGGKSKKNKEEVAEVEKKIKLHAFHVYNLELILRALDNDALNHEDVDMLRDDVEFYVSNNNEPGLVEDPSLYEGLELESVLGVLGKEVVGEVGVPGMANDDAKDKDKTSRLRKSESEVADEAAKAEALDRKNKQDKLQKEQQERQRLIMEREEMARKRREQMTKEAEEAAAAPARSAGNVAAPASTAAASSASAGDKDAGDSAPAMTAAAVVAQGGAPSTTARDVVIGLAPLIRPAEQSSSTQLPALQQPASGPPPLATPTLAPLLIPPAAPLQPMPPIWAHLDQARRLACFDASLSSIPTLVDSERSKLYVPQNPFLGVLPTQFPTVPAARFETPAAFDRMDPDTLFFLFYHETGTLQQYLAAKELRRTDWRFHRQFQCWFKRHEDPTAINADFEQGTFVYFDPTVWQQRVRAGFVLEYSKLEWN